jgi:hypothetical protein
MTTAALRTKVHEYIEEADSKVLEVVFKLLEVYRENSSSMLSQKEQEEMIQRSVQYQAGTESSLSLAEAKKKLGES